MQNFYRSTLKVTRFLKVVSFYYNLNNKDIILLVVLNANVTQLFLDKDKFIVKASIWKEKFLTAQIYVF